MAELPPAARKPSLPEMLAEPIVRAVMARDGVEQRDVVMALAMARDRNTGAEAALARAGAHARMRGFPGPQRRGL